MATVLVVDPSPLWLGYIADLFADKGDGVIPCTNLEQANIALAEHLPDLVVCEATIVDPGDGIRLAKRLFDQGLAVTLLAYSGAFDGPGVKVISKACACNGDLAEQLLGLIQ